MTNVNKIQSQSQGHSTKYQHQSSQYIINPQWRYRKVLPLAWISSSIHITIANFYFRYYSQRSILFNHVLYHEQNLWGYTKYIIKSQGFSSLFKENISKIILFSPIQALILTSKDYFRRKMHQNHQKQSFYKLLLKNCVAGGISTYLVLFIFYSFLRRWHKLQIIKQKPIWQQNNENLLSQYKKTYASGGIRELYKGFVLYSYYQILYYALFFGFYDTLKQKLPGQKQQNILWNLVLGTFCSTFSHFISFPLLTTKYINQTNNKSPTMVWIKECKKMYSQQGIKAFYKGYAYYFFRTHLVRGFWLAFYDRLKLLTNQKQMMLRY